MYLLIKLNNLQKESLKSIEPCLNDHDGSTHKSNGWLLPEERHKQDQ
jgi:hypothetical protein